LVFCATTWPSIFPTACASLFCPFLLHVRIPTTLFLPLCLQPHRQLFSPLRSAFRRQAEPSFFSPAEMLVSVSRLFFFFCATTFFRRFSPNFSAFPCWTTLHSYQKLSSFLLFIVRYPPRSTRPPLSFGWYVGRVV